MCVRRGGGMVYAGDSKSPDRKVLWVQVPPPAQIETSSELRTEGRRAAGAAESKRARRVATKCDGAGTEKRAVLSLFRIRIIFKNYDQTKILPLRSQEHRRR